MAAGAGPSHLSDSVADGPGDDAREASSPGIKLALTRGSSEGCCETVAFSVSQDPQAANSSESRSRLGAGDEAQNSGRGGARSSMLPLEPEQAQVMTVSATQRRPEACSNPVNGGAGRGKERVAKVPCPRDERSLQKMKKATQDCGVVKQSTAARGKVLQLRVEGLSARDGETEEETFDRLLGQFIVTEVGGMAARAEIILDSVLHSPAHVLGSREGRAAHISLKGVRMLQNVT